jgi:hypothetical protein
MYINAHNIVAGSREVAGLCFSKRLQPFFEERLPGAIGSGKRKISVEPFCLQTGFNTAKAGVRIFRQDACFSQSDVSDS